ncbi:hypothetical protein Hanom_Chr04g00309501 [Helianthus anomalus]
MGIEPVTSTLYNKHIVYYSPATEKLWHITQISTSTKEIIPLRNKHHINSKSLKNNIVCILSHKLGIIKKYYFFVLYMFVFTPLESVHQQKNTINETLMYRVWDFPTNLLY